MDTQHLKAFTAVATTKSFSEAATRLHLTQPAVSKRIATLEQQLNCRLFDRIGRTISLTEAGRALLPRAQQILQSIADTELALTNLAGTIGGNLRLATSHHIGLHHLPAILQTFTRQHPEVTLELDFMDSEKALEAVQRGEMELAVITLPQQPPAQIQAITLWPDPLSLVVSNNHPLTQNSAVNLGHLGHYPAILPDQNTHTTQLVKTLFEQHQQPLNLSMATNFLETIKMMVSIGLGWSALPNSMLDPQLTALHIDELQPKNLQLERKLGYIHHRQRTLSNAASAFLSALNDSRITAPNMDQLTDSSRQPL